MVDRDEQTEIALSPIVSTLAGISIDVRAVCRNADSPIVFSFDPFSKVIDCKEDPVNASFSMNSTLAGILMEVSLL